jgi:DICT domain-containing protein
MIEAVSQESRELQVYLDDPPAKAISDIATFFDVPDSAVTVRRATKTKPNIVLVAGGEELLTASVDRLWEAVTTTAEVIQTGLDPRSVIDQLDTATFRSQSVPQLVVASRYIERLAERQGEGTLYACFQHLSRIERDLRTMLYYSVLAESNLDVHQFGFPDTELNTTDGLIVHGLESEELAQTWLVAYDGNGVDDKKGALVAQEIGPRQYRGFWTFEPARADEIISYLTSTYLS